MAEYHDTGATKQENYAREKNQINQNFDKEVKNKSIFTSKSSIEDDRKKALKKLDSDYYGDNRGGGFFSE